MQTYELLKHKKEITEIDISKNSFKIYTKDGVINILEIQIAEKERWILNHF